MELTKLIKLAGLLEGADKAFDIADHKQAFEDALGLPANVITWPSGKYLMADFKADQVNSGLLSLENKDKEWILDVVVSNHDGSGGSERKFAYSTLESALEGAKTKIADLRKKHKNLVAY